LSPEKFSRWTLPTASASCRENRIPINVPFNIRVIAYQWFATGLTHRMVVEKNIGSLIVTVAP
jgi:hypothetical protein